MNLDDIARAADSELSPVGPDAGGPAPEPGAAAPAVDADEQQARDWSQVPAVFGMILARALPDLRSVYTPENNLEWGRAMVPVAQLYGWTPAGFLAWLGPWVGLAIASERLAGPTYDAIRAEVARRKQAQAEAAAAGGGDKPAA